MLGMCPVYTTETVLCLFCRDSVRSTERTRNWHDPVSLVSATAKSCPESFRSRQRARFCPFYNGLIMPGICPVYTMDTVLSVLFRESVLHSGHETKSCPESVRSTQRTRFCSFYNGQIMPGICTFCVGNQLGLQSGHKTDNRTYMTLSVLCSQRSSRVRSVWGICSIYTTHTVLSVLCVGNLSGLQSGHEITEWNGQQNGDDSVYFVTTTAK